MLRSTHNTQSHNLAARMGRWSAAHWKTATFGWLAFVLVAFGLGGMVGTRNIDNTAGTGRVRPHGPDPRGRLQAARRRARPDPEPLGSRRHGRLRLRDRGRRRARSRRSRTSRTSARRSPPATRTTISKDGRSALVEFQIRGAKDKAVDKIDPVLDAVAAAQRAHPDFSIGEFGDASAEKGVVTAYDNDLGKAGTLSLPITLIVLVAHLRLARRGGYSAAARADRHLRDLRARRALERPAAGRDAGLRRWCS